ncbi:hypothetical protein Pd630_LPD02564 [Rhodococcus opacus PD630]|nr:hypothetical protein Pd630_LPD02564 [Rhodococcus opacus PD630]
MCDDGNVTEAGDGHAVALLAELIRPRESSLARLSGGRPCHLDSESSSRRW